MYCIGWKHKISARAVKYHQATFGHDFALDIDHLPKLDVLYGFESGFEGSHRRPLFGRHARTVKPMQILTHDDKGLEPQKSCHY